MAKNMAGIIGDISFSKEELWLWAQKDGRSIFVALPHGVIDD